MKFCATTIFVLTFSLIAGCKGHSEEELRAPRAALAQLESERSRLMAEKATLAIRQSTAKDQLELVRLTAEDVAKKVNGFGDDIKANQRDIIPDSIEHMVTQFNGIARQLAMVDLSATSPEYKAAFEAYRLGCEELRDAETSRLRIIYTHLNTLDKIGSWQPETQDGKNLQQFLGGYGIGDWLAQGTKANEYIEKALGDMAKGVQSLNTAQNSLGEYFAGESQRLDSELNTLEARISEENSKLRKLGG